MVSDLDLQGKLWIKLRLAPICPWIGTIFLAFVGPPQIRVQLSPYNRLPLMRIPIIQKLLAKLLIEDLPALMVLPKRIEINIPASITTLAEAAVGRDAVMQALASAVLQVREAGKPHLSAGERDLNFSSLSSLSSLFVFPPFPSYLPPNIQSPLVLTPYLTAFPP